jgi:PAT family beta-lactamase induction signal transducer AmpG
VPETNEADEAPSTPNAANTEIPKDPRGARAAVWTSSTYFAEGFPYTIVNGLPEMLFKEFGASLESIGLTSLFHLPWNLKFLWGPFLDRFGTKRKWLLGVEVVLTALLFALAAAVSGGNVLVAASVCFFAIAIAAATHDIAIDGYYLEALDEADQSRFVGTRATAYRIAMLAASGPLVLLIGKVGWTYALLFGATTMGGLLLFHTRFLPRVETETRPIRELLPLLATPTMLGGVASLGAAIWVLWELAARGAAGTLPEPFASIFGAVSFSGWLGLTLLAALGAILLALPRIRTRMESSESFYAEAFVNFLAQDRIAVILGFVILFRAGESFLLKMRYAFLSDIGISIEQYGIASGTFGVIASFVATIAAGWLISSGGLRKWIWPFVLGQNLLNLLYAVLAAHYAPLWLDPGSGSASMVVVTVTIIIESAGAGLGTAVFMVYLMRCCRPGYKAAHMAILTALMSVSFTLAGVASGFLATRLGFTNYFVFTFLTTIPGMLLIFRLPYLDSAPVAKTA